MDDILSRLRTAIDEQLGKELGILVDAAKKTSIANTGNAEWLQDMLKGLIKGSCNAIATAGLAQVLTELYFEEMLENILSNPDEEEIADLLAKSILFRNSMRKLLDIHMEMIGWVGDGRLAARVKLRYEELVSEKGGSND